MKVKELVDKINTEGVPIFFHDIPKANRDYCYTCIATATELAQLRKKDANCIENEELGVHLCNADVEQVYNSYSNKNAIAVQNICTMLKGHYSISDDKIVIAYVLFIILHEIGHWKHLMKSGMNRIDYWETYESPRDPLWIEFQMAYNLVARTKQDKQRVLAYYDEKYRNLPSEKFADDFAIKELPKYLDLSD